MDAPARLCDRNALNTMHSALELKLAKSPRTLNRQDNVAETPDSTLLSVHQLDLPAAPLGIARVHAQEIAREQGCLISAGPRPNLQQDVLVVVRILGEKQNLEFLLQ